MWSLNYSILEMFYLFFKRFAEFRVQQSFFQSMGLSNQFCYFRGNGGGNHIWGGLAMSFTHKYHPVPQPYHRNILHQGTFYSGQYQTNKSRAFCRKLVLKERNNIIISGKLPNASIWISYSVVSFLIGQIKKSNVRSWRRRHRTFHIAFSNIFQFFKVPQSLKNYKNRSIRNQNH